MICRRAAVGMSCSTRTRQPFGRSISTSLRTAASCGGPATGSVEIGTPAPSVVPSTIGTKLPGPSRSGANRPSRTSESFPSRGIPRWVSDEALGSMDRSNGPPFDAIL